MLTFTTEINGTFLQGYVNTTYQKLVEVFGEPHFKGNDDKVTCEWNFKTDKGVVFTIYDYKMGETPMSHYDWHIGGRNLSAVSAVREYFPDAVMM